MGRLTSARRRFRSELSAEQQRGARILAWASILVLAGVSLTGLWQFFRHESDSGWYGYVPGNDARQVPVPSSAIAEWHGNFGAAVAVLALIGGAWFAYRVLYDIPWRAVIALLVAVFGLVTGSVIRYNVVKLTGREYEEADRGYLQLFTGDLEFMATDAWELGATAARLWTAAHVLTVPVLLLLVWTGLSDDAEA